MLHHQRRSFVNTKTSSSAVSNVLSIALPLPKPQQRHESSVFQTLGKFSMICLTSMSMMAGYADAATTTVKMGSDTGDLAFVPQVVKVKKGDVVTWVNNAAFPHNIVFDDVPDGADADALSHEDLFNSPSDKFTQTFDVPGEYKYHCDPHSSVMTGTIVVSE